MYNNKNNSKLCLVHLIDKCETFDFYIHPLTYKKAKLTWQSSPRHSTTPHPTQPQPLPQSQPQQQQQLGRQLREPNDPLLL